MDLYRIYFSDPQGGKGPCDRKAAQIKTHVKKYINQGHSVTTPVDLKKAIESDIAGVRVTVVPVPKTTVKTKGIKWEGIISLSNFEITAAGVKAFKVHAILDVIFRYVQPRGGKGKLLAFVLKWISVRYIILVS